MEIRKEKEKLFHDKLRINSLGQRWSPNLEEKIRTDPLWSNMKYYAVERKSRLLVNEWLMKNCRGKEVLDFCCGNGEDTVFLAKNGARKVVGIDISDVSIDNCIRRSIEEDISDKVSFLVMDAENLRFDDNQFDIITEYGALHHIDLEKAFSGIARILRPDGKLICVEALGHNPIIRQYRKRTMHLRTQWEVEHILKKKDIEKGSQYFNKVEFIKFYHLATIAAVPFRNFLGFETILSTLEAIDRVLVNLPILKWQAWQVVFVLSQPKKTFEER
jgi:ubiquinone/menaquinone biosynthesis C-methylase UbiE